MWGSGRLLVDSSNNPVAGSRLRYRPGSAPSQTGNGRDFTGQRENMELGLLPRWGVVFWVCCGVAGLPTVPPVLASHQPVFRPFRHSFSRFSWWGGFMTFCDTGNDYSHTFNVENELVSMSNNGRSPHNEWGDSALA